MCVRVCVCACVCVFAQKGSNTRNGCHGGDGAVGVLRVCPLHIRFVLAATTAFSARICCGYGLGRWTAGWRASIRAIVLIQPIKLVLPVSLGMCVCVRACVRVCVRACVMCERPVSALDTCVSVMCVSLERVRVWPNEGEDDGQNKDAVKVRKHDNQPKQLEQHLQFGK